MAFIDDIKDTIIDKLSEYEGVSTYVSDFGYTMTEYENANGSWLMYYDECKKFICENFDECSDFFDYYQSEFGVGLNPFEDDGNKFTTVMFIEAVESVYAQAMNNQDKYDWNDEVTVDQEFINTVISALDSVTRLW